MMAVVASSVILAAGVVEVVPIDVVSADVVMAAQPKEAEQELTKQQRHADNCTAKKKRFHDATSLRRERSLPGAQEGQGDVPLMIVVVCLAVNHLPHESRRPPTRVVPTA